MVVGEGFRVLSRRNAAQHRKRYCLKIPANKDAAAAPLRSPGVYERRGTGDEEIFTRIR